MMIRLLPLLLVLSAPSALAAPWLCTLPDGRKAFSYEPESSKDPACVDHPISRGYVRRAPPRDADPYASRADFPRVDAKTQKQRDVARREILERELAQEKKALVDALRSLADLKEARVALTAPEVVSDYEARIRTHRTNIANLEKELGRSG
jgi:hypothetical protein